MNHISLSLKVTKLSHVYHRYHVTVSYDFCRHFPLVRDKEPFVSFLGFKLLVFTLFFLNCISSLRSTSVMLFSLLMLIHYLHTNIFVLLIAISLRYLSKRSLFHTQISPLYLSQDNLSLGRLH